MPPTGEPVPEDFFEDIYATYEFDEDPTRCRRAQVVAGLRILGGPYGAATHVGPILAERLTAHERLTTLTTENAEAGQRHATIRLLQTAACRRHQNLGRALHPEASRPLLAQADELNEETLLYTLDVATNVADEIAKENLDNLRQHLHLSTDFGGYNLLTRLVDEHHIAHYASITATIHPLHELMLRHAPN